MATGLFNTRDLTRVTHRAKVPAKKQGPKRGLGWRRDDAKTAALCDEIAGLIADGMSINAASRHMGISTSYGQKLFAQVRAALGED